MEVIQAPPVRRGSVFQAPPLFQRSETRISGFSSAPRPVPKHSDSFCSYGPEVQRGNSASPSEMSTRTSSSHSSKMQRFWLTFTDHAMEKEFLSKVDDGNVLPATLLLLVAFVFEVMYCFTGSSIWLAEVSEHEEFKALILSSNIVGVMSTGVPLVLLWRRWCNCEILMIFVAIMMSCSMFTNNAYFMAKLFGFPGDFLLLFFAGEPMVILALALINGCVHEVIVQRASRSWILPVSQVLILGAFRLFLAPHPWTDTLGICLMYITATILAWRGTRQDERRARSDYLDNHELHTAMSRERHFSMLQTQKLQEVEDRLGAFESWAGRQSMGEEALVGSMISGTARVMSLLHEEDLTVPWPPRHLDQTAKLQVLASDTGGADTGSPSHLLRVAMAGRRADALLIRKMANQITSSSYGIKEFFEDAIAAFPELELFFVMHGGNPAHRAVDFNQSQDGKPKLADFSPNQDLAQDVQRARGELEYQRTIGALFSVYWLLRLDIDGKEGFCWGVTGEDWEVGGLPMQQLSSIHPDTTRRGMFVESADWATIRAMVTASLGDADADSPLEIERVEAMLCLTAFHDVLKMEWLCPVVAEAHGPYRGYLAGAVIHDHDIALSYVMEHWPELLPSYSILSPRMQELVLFTQGKMQFNHGWFVQAEAPPGLMLSSLKGCLAAAQPGDLPFYFFHWITDLSGAEGRPKGGAEKLVLKFPEPVLAAFLWSIPYLEHLVEKNETQVTEQYLAARWRSMFPGIMLPVGPSSVALLRLIVMAQGEAGDVAEAFHSISPFAQDVLSKELSRSGCQDQYFECCPACGGPALLIYYGPALLQRCRGVEEMAMGLHILAATFAAGRGLWPVSLESQGSTVLIDLAQLRTHPIGDIMGTASTAQGSLWVMRPKNEREALLELKLVGEVNQLSRQGSNYWILDPRLSIEKEYAIRC